MNVELKFPNNMICKKEDFALRIIYKEGIIISLELKIIKLYLFAFPEEKVIKR